MADRREQETQGNRAWRSQEDRYQEALEALAQAWELPVALVRELGELNPHKGVGLALSEVRRVVRRMEEIQVDTLATENSPYAAPYAARVGRISGYRDVLGWLIELEKEVREARHLAYQEGENTYEREQNPYF